jgi:hypothetical protein
MPYSQMLLLLLHAGLGIFFQVSAASAAVYTLWLLSALYHEFKRHAVRGAGCMNHHPSSWQRSRKDTVLNGGDCTATVAVA